ncbi:MAG: nucleotidyl transferase AbiEii/AbiGii toxin family protein [Alphaproteobacteria bacterium]|nr:MAG: nucleotidyl transferase AbiEii/AbiGii toxin family protein [Alphaproteobacteria bacterium]
MIEVSETDRKALELDIDPVDVERDYVFGWLLKAFYEDDYLRDLLVFKGGNCLRKAYCPDSRFSNDLDFSVSRAIDQPRLLNAINEACREAQRLCGVEFLTDRNTLVAASFGDRSRTVYKGHLYFNDFLGEEDDLTISIKVDIAELDRLYLPVTSKPLVHGYSDFAECRADLTCMALEEIVALKLKCLLQRRHAADLFDLVHTTFMDRSLEIDRKLVLRVFLQKTIFGNNPGAAKEILLGVPMTFFGGLWSKFKQAPKQVRFGFDTAVEGYKASIDSLFEGTSMPVWGDDQFFPSVERNLIMTAGAERTLLRLRYGGVERLIEPYSLTYKQAQGKPAREYFYGYDRTGGSTSGPGIKSFVHASVEDLQPTEEKFEPRFEIELSKAGEMAGKGYFRKGFSASDRRSPKPRLARSARSFKLQCPYCQKVFTRTTRDSTLNEHKAPNGFRCGGRRGSWVS